MKANGTSVAHHAGPDLDELRLQARQRPVGHGLGQFDAAQESRQIVVCGVPDPWISHIFIG